MLHYLEMPGSVDHLRFAVVMVMSRRRVAMGLENVKTVLESCLKGVNVFCVDDAV